MVTTEILSKREKILAIVGTFVLIAFVAVGYSNAEGSASSLQSQQQRQQPMETGVDQKVPLLKEKKPPPRPVALKIEKKEVQQYENKNSTIENHDGKAVSTPQEKKALTQEQIQEELEDNKNRFAFLIKVHGRISRSFAQEQDRKETAASLQKVLEKTEKITTEEALADFENFVKTFDYVIEEIKGYERHLRFIRENIDSLPAGSEKENLEKLYKTILEKLKSMWKLAATDSVRAFVELAQLQSLYDKAYELIKAAR